jgi:hypothetical protein
MSWFKLQNVGIGNARKIMLEHMKIMSKLELLEQAALKMTPSKSNSKDSESDISERL